MKLSMLSAATAAFIAIATTSASALPVAKPGQVGAERTAMTEQIRHKRGHVSNRGHRPSHYGNRNRHGNDHRYNQYRGWHRYNHRPHGWRNRGCVAVGPIWFCK